MRKNIDEQDARPKGLSDRGHLIFSVLVVIGFVTAPLLVIRLEADSPAEWPLLFLFYLCGVGLVLYAIAWVIGLAVALSQKRDEKEELEDAKKY